MQQTALRIIDSFKFRLQHNTFKIKNIFHKKILGGQDFPQFVHIENTNACAAKCIMCPRDSHTRHQGFMKMPLFKKIIDECATKWQLQEVHLHGFGEALLEQSIPEKVAYAKKKGIKNTYIVTTGSELSEDMSKRLILAGLDKVKISFYGATKKTYEDIHVRLKYDSVVANIKRLFEIRKETGRKNPKIVLQFLPQASNVDEKNIFLSLWKNYINTRIGDRFEIADLHNYGGGREYIDVHNTKITKKCGLPFTTMQIYWDGTVVSCCFDYNGNFVLDNVKEKTLQTAWNNKIFQRLRVAQNALDLKEFPFCNTCDVIPRS